MMIVKFTSCSVCRGFVSSFFFIKNGRKETSETRVSLYLKDRQEQVLTKLTRTRTRQ